MSWSRYAARTAGFALLYVLATVAGGWTEVAGVHLLWPAAAVGAVWLVAQATYGKRNLDVIALGVLATLLPGSSTGILTALAMAMPQVVPALIFAWLTDRWLPGFWLGHGDRFRRFGRTVARLAAISAVASVAGVMLRHIVSQEEVSAAVTGYPVLRDTVAVFVAVLVVRAARLRGTGPRAGAGLAVVR